MKKFSLLFLFLIVVIKLVYLYFEADYNGYLLDTVTNGEVTKEIFDSLEHYGHTLSAIGLTLLIVPMLYILFKKYLNEIKTLLILMPISYALFFGFYNGLNYAIDEIVEKNKDKRYSSYYTTILKYGLINNKMGYNSLVPNERLKNLSIEDKVMVSNIFLLAFTEKAFIDKLIGSKDKLVGAFISQYHYEDYKKAETEFNKTVSEVNQLYKEYKQGNNKIDKKFSKVDTKLVANAEYQQFKNDLEYKYLDYKKKSKEYNKSINPSSNEVEKYYKDLKKFFRYRKHTRAKNSYIADMRSNFGHYIVPERWCEGSICPTRGSIRRVIREEASSKWTKRMGNIRPGLSKRDFFTHADTRKRVAQELRRKGLRVSNNFNYSKKSFIAAYKNKISSEFNKVSKEFTTKFKKRFNKNVKVGLSYKSFSYYWKKELVTKYGKKHGTVLYGLLRNSNTNGFYDKFYIPYFAEKKLGDYILTEEELNSKEHSQKGDDAIKNLFVTPFAIAMSLISAVLNLVSVIVLILIIVLRFTASERNSAIIVNIVKVSLYASIIYFPYSYGKENEVLKSYKLLEKTKDTNFGKKYNEVLNWILVCERFNYKYIYEPYMKESKTTK